MSGSSDYTTTPNLGLFKPIFNMAVGQWGDLWNSNADALDSALSTGSGGKFLPLSGGTATGPITVSGPNTVTLAGGAAGVPARITTTGPWADLQILPKDGGKLYATFSRTWPAASGTLEMCRFDYSMAGTASGQAYSAELHAIDTDTVTGTGAGYFNYMGGPNAGAAGGRTAFGVNFQQGGATTVGANGFYVGSAVFAFASYNGGGNSSVTMGALFASNDMALLQTGATWWEELCGYELDIGAATGTSFSYKHGMKVNLWPTDATSGRAGADSAYSTSANATTGPTSGWDVGFAFNDGYGYWPMKTTGKMIGTVVGHAGGPAYACAWGIDFSAVAFSGGLIRGPGFSIDGAGQVAPHLANATNDAAAATAGVPIGTLYRNGNAVQVRLV